jgi:hypothetical protein
MARKYPVVMTLRLTDSDMALLHQEAEKDDRAPSAYGRKLVLQGLAKWLAAQDNPTP